MSKKITYNCQKTGQKWWKYHLQTFFRGSTPRVGQTRGRGRRWWWFEIEVNTRQRIPALSKPKSHFGHPHFSTIHILLYLPMAFLFFYLPIGQVSSSWFLTYLRHIICCKKVPTEEKTNMEFYFEIEATSEPNWKQFFRVCLILLKRLETAKNLTQNEWGMGQRLVSFLVYQQQGTWYSTKTSQWIWKRFLLAYYKI